MHVTKTETKSVQVHRAWFHIEIHTRHCVVCEINEDQPNENTRRPSPQNLPFMEGSQLSSLTFGRDQRQAEERGSFVEEKRKALGVPQLRALGRGKPQEGQPEARHPL